MKKTLALITALTTSSLVMAEEQTSSDLANNLYIGGTLSHNMVDSAFGDGSLDAPGYGLFLGYKLNDDMPDIDTSIEIGYSQTDEFFDGRNNEINGIWVAAVGEKRLPEISPKVSVLARLGLDFGDDDGILMGAGMGFHPSDRVALRGEYLNKDSSSVIQLSAVINF